MILAGFALIERSLKSISLSSTLAIVYLAFVAAMLAGSRHSTGTVLSPLFVAKVWASGI